MTEVWRRRVAPGRQAKFNLVPLGCVHVGHRNFDRDYFEETVRWIRANRANTLAIGMGDYADAIVATDVRYDRLSVDPEFPDPDAQYAYIREWFGKIRDQLVGLHVGNHDDVIRRRHFHDFVADLCRGLRVPSLRVVALGTLSFGRWASYTVFSTHGSTASLQPGSKLKRVTDFASAVEADVYLMGHAHDRLVYTDNLVRVARGRLATKKRVYAVTGTFLRSYSQGKDSYIEWRTPRATRIGVPKIQFFPRGRDLHATI